MTVLKFFVVLSLTLGAWLGMGLTMRGGEATWKRTLVVFGCFAVFLGAIWLGMYWKHADFTCHPGHPCFPWGW